MDAASSLQQASAVTWVSANPGITAVLAPSLSSSFFHMKASSANYGCMSCALQNISNIEASNLQPAFGIPSQYDMWLAADFLLLQSLPIANAVDLMCTAD